MCAILGQMGRQISMGRQVSIGRQTSNADDEPPRTSLSGSVSGSLQPHVFFLPLVNESMVQLDIRKATSTQGARMLLDLLGLGFGETH